MRDRVFLWGVPLVALAVFLHLVLVLYPQLAAASGAGTPFDLRFMGYGLTEARAYVAQLTPEGLALYQGPVRINDTFLPIWVMVTLMLALRGRGQVWFLPALAYGLADLGENIAVGRLLTAGAEMTASDVMLASTLTQAKFAALGVSVLLAGWTLWQHWRER